MGRFTAPALTRAVLCLLPAAAILAAPAWLRAQNETVFKVDVRLVRMLVTVKDQYGKLIGSLNKEDFDVFDNGVEQKVALFERHTEQPLSITLLVDTSASTMKDLQYEVDSVKRFLRALFKDGNPDDAVALFSFNYDVTLESSFTRRISRLEAALKNLKPEGGTSMYDALCFSADKLEDREGRHVVILVTDGGDTTSSRTFHQAREAVQKADAVIYPILVMPITNDAGRNIGGENALTTLAHDTGGRVFAPSIGPQLDAAFAEILRDLRTQYLIGFYPKNVPLTKERFHRLEVKVPSHPDLRAVSRTGYYGDAEQPAGRSSDGPGLPPRVR